MSAQDSPSSTKSCSLIIVSWPHMSLERLFTEKNETCSDHSEENADRTENSLGRYDARELFREVQAIDSHIE